MQAPGREAGLDPLDVRPPEGSHRAHVRAGRARQRGRGPHRRRRRSAGDLVDRRVARRAARHVRVLPVRDARPAPRRRRRCGPRRCRPGSTVCCGRSARRSPIVALRGTINRGRASLGLAADRQPAHAYLRQPASSSRPIAIWRRPATMRRRALVGTDALDLRRAARSSIRVVDAFLNLDPAPIYVGFGSMVARARRRSRRPGDRRCTRRRPSRAHRRRAGPGSIATSAQADDILTIGAMPHRAVFPRVAAIVHHGGAGTTTAAASRGRAAGDPAAPPRSVLLGASHRAARPRARGAARSTSSPPTSSPTASTSRSTTRASANAPRRSGPAIAARNGADAAVDQLERLVNRLVARPRLGRG